MIGTYAYCCARMGQGKRRELEELFKHLAWLCSNAVAYCRKQYAKYGPTPSGFVLSKRLIEMRDGDDHATSKPVRAQRSMLRRASGGYKRMLKLGAGRPCFRPEVRSFELHASKPRRAGKGWTVQIKSDGKVQFNGTVSDR